jgi:hypothetical protein
MRRRWCAHCEAIGQRFERDESNSPRGIMPSLCTSAVLVFSYCGSVAALPFLANCNEHVPKQVYSDRTRPQLTRFERHPQVERPEW